MSDKNEKGNEHAQTSPSLRNTINANLRNSGKRIEAVEQELLVATELADETITQIRNRVAASQGKGRACVSGLVSRLHSLMSQIDKLDTSYIVAIDQHASLKNFKEEAKAVGYGIPATG